MNLTVHSIPVAEAGQRDTLTCATDSIALDGTASETGPDITYQWNGSGLTSGSTTMSPFVTQSGTYYLTVTDTATGCINTDSVSVGIDTTTPTAGITGYPGNITCEHPTRQLEATGGESYQWTTSDGIISSGENSATASISAGGTYSVIVTGDNQCNDTTSISIVTDTIAPVASVSGDTSRCGPGPVSLTASGGSHYQWSSGDTTASIQPTINTTTDYTVTVTGNNGCSDIAQITATVHTISGATISGPPPFYQTDTVTFTNVAPAGVYDVIWGSASGNASVVSSTDTSAAMVWNTQQSDSVTLQLIDTQHGCDTTVKYPVSVNSLEDLTVDIIVRSPIQCHDSSDAILMVAAEGGMRPYSYNWSTGQTDSLITDCGSGTYKVTVTTANGSGSDSVTLSEPHQITIDPSTQHINCPSDKATGRIHLNIEGGSPPYTYQWLDISANTDMRQNLAAGTYEVTVTDTNNCKVKDSFTITKPKPITVAIQTEDPYCEQTQDGLIEIESISGGTSPYSYSWSHSDMATGTYINNIGMGDYTVTITDAHNCDTAITAKLERKHTNCLRIPSAFSPNGDNINDTWVIENITLYPEASIEIYNRWGDLVFQTENGVESSTIWDGTYKGKPLPVDSYHYIIDLNNGDKPITGSVTIVR
jgi:gliding motility-associated-like protein